MNLWRISPKVVMCVRQVCCPFLDCEGAKLSWRPEHYSKYFVLKYNLFIWIFIENPSPLGEWTNELFVGTHCCPILEKVSLECATMFTVMIRWNEKFRYVHRSPYHAFSIAPWDSFPLHIDALNTCIANSNSMNVPQFCLLIAIDHDKTQWHKFWSTLFYLKWQMCS